MAACLLVWLVGSLGWMTDWLAVCLLKAVVVPVPRAGRGSGIIWKLFKTPNRCWMLRFPFRPSYTHNFWIHRKKSANPRPTIIIVTHQTTLSISNEDWRLRLLCRRRCRRHHLQLQHHHFISITYKNPWQKINEIAKAKMKFEKKKTGKAYGSQLYREKCKKNIYIWSKVLQLFWWR